MPTILKVANVHFTQTGNNRLEYTGNGVIRLSANGIQIPLGTNGERPIATNEQLRGIIRFDTTNNTFEGHNGASWGAIGGGVSTVAGKTGAVTLTKEDVGLNNVDNTSDANKPVSSSVQSALDGKAALVHTHAIANVTGLQTALDGKAALVHTHAIANVTGLQTALDGKLSNTTGTFAGSLTVLGTLTSTGAISGPSLSTTGVISGLSLTTTSHVSDASGNVRVIPLNSRSSAYTLIKSDVGKFVRISAGGVTVPASVFSPGDAISIYNNSGSSQTITQGLSVTLYLGGTATTGNRTLAQRGIATILCVDSDEFVITGSGIS